MSKRGKKRNFTECEVETLLNEVEARKKCLFGTLSSGITAKRKRSIPPVLSRQRHRFFSCPIALSTTDRVREWRELYLRSRSVCGLQRGGHQPRLERVAAVS
ncbi:hypothetical protein MHYP_G00322420 [Metynnis hypsauchen]